MKSFRELKREDFPQKRVGVKPTTTEVLATLQLHEEDWRPFSGSGGLMYSEVAKPRVRLDVKSFGKLVSLPVYWGVSPLVKMGYNFECSDCGKSEISKLTTSTKKCRCGGVAYRQWADTENCGKEFSELMRLAKDSKRVFASMYKEAKVLFPKPFKAINRNSPIDSFLKGVEKGSILEALIEARFIPCSVNDSKSFWVSQSSEGFIPLKVIRGFMPLRPVKVNKKNDSLRRAF